MKKNMSNFFRHKLYCARIQNDELSAENCKYIKGIMAILILAHHVYQHSGILKNTLIAPILQALGCWVVGVFFFISGYGLLQSYHVKRKKYIMEFPLHRILPFYLLMVILIIIYGITGILLKESFDFKTIVCSFTFGGTIIKNGWYLQVQMLLYIIFYVTLLIFPNKRSIYIMLLEIIIYITIAILSGISLICYATVPLFFLGLLWSTYKEKFDSILFVFSKGLLCACISIVTCIFFYKLYSFFDSVYLKALFLCLSSVSFSILVISLVCWIPIKCRMTHFFGKISLEIYVTQGIFLYLFHSDIVYLLNPYIYLLAVTICTIALSIMIHPLTNFIFAFCKKL